MAQRQPLPAPTAPISVPGVKVRVPRSLLLAVLALGCAACTNLWTTTYRTVKPSFEWQESKADRLLQKSTAPSLKVWSAGNVSVWALADSAGATQVWVSHDGAMIKTNAGHLVSAQGFDVNFDQESEARPVDPLGSTPWARVIRVSSPARVGVSLTVQAHEVTHPPRRLRSLRRMPLRWVEEQSFEPGSKTVLKGAYGYARTQRDAWVVVAGYQCLSTDFCIAWQFVPAATVDAP